MPAQHGLRPHQQPAPCSSWQPLCQHPQDHAIGWLQPWLFDSATENAQLVAKEEELHLTIAVSQLEREQTDKEAQAAVDASKDQMRRAW